MINRELIVDNFAGGGGASTGIELATGYSVDIAINHDPEAIRMHRANLPELCIAKRMPICRPDRMKQEETGQLKFA